MQSFFYLPKNVVLTVGQFLEMMMPIEMGLVRPKNGPSFTSDLDSIFKKPEKPLKKDPDRQIKDIWQPTLHTVCTW